VTLALLKDEERPRVFGTPLTHQLGKA